MKTPSNCILIMGQGTTFFDQLEQYLRDMPFHAFHERLKVLLNGLNQEELESLLSMRIADGSRNFISLWAQMLLCKDDLALEEYRCIFIILERKIWKASSREITNRRISNLAEATRIIDEYHHEVIAEMKNLLDSSDRK